MRIGAPVIRKVLLRPFSRSSARSLVQCRRSSTDQSTSSAKQMSGFEVEKVDTVDDFNMKIVQMVHVKSGARLLHLDRKDTNCAFSISIPTVPLNDRGTPHVLEHMVLCGSQKYPCRDPFFKMLTRSVANFLNAMTFPQYTSYVFSTENQRDYMNLLNVYFDSVFNPLLNYLDFLQEAWRLIDLDADKKQSLRDWDKPDNVLVQGVVFNEMKGVQSDPSQIIYRQCIKSLFGYGDSGGIPAEILSLNNKELCRFHEQNYKIANARFVVYGSNVNLPSVLERLNDMILAKAASEPAAVEPKVEAEAEEEEVSIWPKLQPRPEERLEIECPKTDLTFDPNRPFSLSQSFNVGRQGNNWDDFIMSMIDLLIIDSESSPIYQHLIASGLASSLASFSGYDANTFDTCFHIALQGVADVKGACDAIDRAIKEIISTGFEQEEIEAALHKIELNALHVPGSFGTHATVSVIRPWFYGRDIGEAMRISNQIRRFRREIKANPNLLQDKLKSCFIENWSRKTIVMKPSKKYSERIASLEKSRASQRVIDIGLIGLAKMQNDIERMRVHQGKNADSSCLPQLEMSDINRDIKSYEFKEMLSSNRTPILLVPQQTNNLIYLRHMASISLTDEELNYLPLFCAVFDRIGTKRMSYMGLSRYLSTICSGVDCTPSLTVHPLDTNQYELGVMFSSFCTRNNAVKTINAWADILSDFKVALNSNLGAERLKVLIRELAIESVDELTSNGSFLASLRAKSISDSMLAKTRECMSGLQQIELLQKLREEDISPTIQMLCDIYDKVVCALAHRMSIHHDVREKEKLDVLDGWLSLLRLQWPQDEERIGPNWKECPVRLRLINPKDKPKPKTEQYDIDAEVNFCASAVQLNQMKISVIDRARVALNHFVLSLNVFASMLTSEHLLPRIREKHGAYGVSASLSDDGFFCISSYRDPRRQKTLTDFSEIFNEVANSYNVDDVTLRNAKLRTLQTIDRPRSCNNIGMPLFLRGITAEQENDYRNAVIDLSGKQMLASVQRQLINGLVSNCILGNPKTKK